MASFQTFLLNEILLQEVPSFDEFKLTCTGQTTLINAHNRIIVESEPAPFNDGIAHLLESEKDDVTLLELLVVLKR